MAKKSPKLLTVSEKLQALVKNASNGELLAFGTSISAVSEAALATKCPYVASSTAASNSGLAGSMFVNERAVKKEIAGKDSLIKQANDQLVEKEAEIMALKAENEGLKEKNDGLAQLLKKNLFERIFATALWSK